MNQKAKVTLDQKMTIEGHLCFFERYKPAAAVVASEVYKVWPLLEPLV